MVHIEFNVNHIILSKREGDRFQQVILSIQEWSALVELADQIHDHMAKKKEGSWQLPTKGVTVSNLKLMATVSVFEDDAWLNIRQWFTGRPTKQGVTMGVTAFAHLRKSMYHSSEVQLARTVFKEMLVEKCNVMAGERCDGCKKAYSAQKDHSCLDLSRDNMEALIREKPTVDVREFIKRLAARAVNESHCILVERPLDDYKICSFMIIDHLEHEILANYTWV